MKNQAKKTKRKPRIYLSRVIKIAALLLAIVLTTWFLQDYILCNAHHNTERIRGFYLEDEDSLDVVFVGSSEVYCGFAPALAYEECGFTSYPFATETNTVRNYKAIVEEVRRTQSPQLIVVEINGAIYGDQNIDKEVNLRRVSDNMPLNENKIELIEENATSDQIEYYVPFIKYHDSWDNFNISLGWSFSLIRDKLRGHNMLKGVKNRTVIFEPDSKVYSTSEIQRRRLPLFDKSNEALREFLQYLKDEGITKDQILFVRFPHVITDTNVKRYYRGNTIGDIIREYGYTFESFETDEAGIGLDPAHDFYNVEHMNVYGQQKFTKFFADYLKEKYGITPGCLTDEQKAVWDETVPYYHAYVKYNEQMFSEGKETEIGENYFYMRQIEKLMEK